MRMLIVTLSAALMLLSIAPQAEQQFEGHWGQKMIQWDRIELMLAAVAGAALSGVTGIVLGHEGLGPFIWALIGAVVVGAVFYFHRAFR